MLPVLVTKFLLAKYSSPTTASSTLPSSARGVARARVARRPNALRRARAKATARARRRPIVRAMGVATANSYALKTARARKCTNSFRRCCSGCKRSCFFGGVEDVFRRSSFALVGLRYILSGTARHIRGA